MKLRKTEVLAVAVTAAVLAVTAGYQLGLRRRAPVFYVTAETASPAEAGAERININAAGAEELQALSGVGEALARRIVSYREAHGPFQRIEDVTLVSGVGEGILEANRDRMTVGGEGGT